MSEQTMAEAAEEHNRAVLARAAARTAWLVWSNQKGMWWRANRSGYTQFIDEAGRYSAEAATAIVRQATCDGALIHMRTDPVTGRDYEAYDEVAVLAPEATAT